MKKDLILKTDAYKILLRSKLLYDSVAWLDAFKSNPNLKRDIIEWIQQDQLREKGVDSQDAVIGFYSSLTEQINPKKKFNSHYTLEDTGEFFKSMFVRVFYDAISINADADKMQDQDWWRKEIIALNDENLRKFVGALRKSYIRYARKILFNN